MEALDLILNGAELHRGVAGINTYLRLLTEALGRPPETMAWRLAVPRPLVPLCDFLPPSRLIIVDGRDIPGCDVRSLHWNRLIAGHVRRHHPEAVFHSVFHYWVPRPPDKLVITIHDCIEQIEESMRPRSTLLRMSRWLCRRMARRTRRIIAVSNWTRDQIVRHYRIPAERIAVMHNWVRPACLNPPSVEDFARLHRRYHLPDRYIVYVGGYRPYKNVDFLIAAWQIARSDGPMPPLVLAGQMPKAEREGRQRDVWGAIARTGAGSREIIMPGLVADEDLPALYAGASLFVSPSRQEGFGYPVVEAFAAGAPVLVGDASVYPEIVPEEHMRFSLAAPGLLATRMRAALVAPERYRRALDPRFTEEYGKIKYESIIREIRNGPGKSGAA